MHSIEHLGDIIFKGKARMMLWSYRGDSILVRNYIRELHQLTLEIKYCHKRYPKLKEQLKIFRHNMQMDFNHNIDRIWNDQRTGNYFRKGERFEPHQVSINHNLVMWDALSRFTELISGESGDRFDRMAMGTGTRIPAYDDTELEIEIARVDMNASGDLNADGIVLRSTAEFPTGTPDGDVKEFGGLDSDELGTLEYRVLVDGDPLQHRQGSTIVQAAHSIVLQPVENSTT